MVRHVLEVQVRAALDLHVRRDAELPLAQVPGLQRRVLGDARRRHGRAQQPDGVLAVGRLPQREVLPDDHPNADPRRVEAVEEAVDRRVVLERALVVLPELVRAVRHGVQDAGVPLVDRLQ